MIHLENVSRSFGRLQAVDNLSLTVPKGQVLGFLGPNGAGKTTTMRLIAGCLEPDRGTISICGHDMMKNPMLAKRCIGYMPEGAPLYGNIGVFQSLSFVAQARGLFFNEKNKEIDRVVEEVELTNVLHRPVDTLSKGTRRRVALAQALLGNPDVLLLDEPTEGLDPNQKKIVHRLIHRLSSEKAIMISTHILEEIETLCSRTVILDKGQIVLDDVPRAFASLAENHYIVSVVVPDYHQAKAQVLFEEMTQVDIKDVLTQKEGECQFLLKASQTGSPVADVVEALRLQNIKILDISVEKGKLEDVFYAFTTKEREDA